MHAPFDSPGSPDGPAFAPPAPARARHVLRMRKDVLATVEDMVVDEVPVALVYNGISHAVMMATPADLEEFALGFSLSEGIVARPGECYGIEVEPGRDGIAVHVQIAAPDFEAVK
jgi:FdhD protein